MPPTNPTGTVCNAYTIGSIHRPKPEPPLDLSVLLHKAPGCYSNPAAITPRTGAAGLEEASTRTQLSWTEASAAPSGESSAGSTDVPQMPFVQIPGSPAGSGHHGIRRSFLSDSDFHTTKPFSSEAYVPALAKAFPGEPSAAQSYPPGLDPYFAEPYGDYHPTALTPASGSLFGASSLPPLLPPHFPSDSTHFLFRDSWDQMAADSLNQRDTVASDPLQTLSTSPSCLSPLEAGAPSHSRSSGWGPAAAGAQGYTRHSLEDVHSTPGYPGGPAYPLTSFMALSSDLAPKSLQLSPDESAEAAPQHDPPTWPREDGPGIWGPYECRRAY
ncbi:uncharacterized protein C11orf53 homolog [Ornithorhynchus anatinus]|uniref:uncharacterized protein C11orf53 homolog n=1 Tax=Ornithorhynchus anatinus TaxID=9258 RepID=UPI0019D49984|nr:uncharacterized protein C11orf53 homolog [Ornithorhynchus anatinus]